MRVPVRSPDGFADGVILDRVTRLITEGALSPLLKIVSLEPVLTGDRDLDQEGR